MMKTLLHLHLNADNAEEAQKIMDEICSERVREKMINDFRYEIETPEGLVTERCLPANGKVIA